MATERRARKRSRQSAKVAGASFEINQVEYLSKALNNPSINRQDKAGKNDMCDIANLGYLTSGLKGVPFVVECKNLAQMNLTGTMREAHTGADNYLKRYPDRPRPLPIVMHKRHGVGAEAKQWVTMEAETFVQILRLADL